MKGISDSCCAWSSRPCFSADSSCAVGSMCAAEPPRGRYDAHAPTPGTVQYLYCTVPLRPEKGSEREAASQARFGFQTVPVKRHRGEPGHTRDTRTHKGTRTAQTNLTTIQTHQQRATRTSARRPRPRPTQEPQARSRPPPAADSEEATPSKPDPASTGGDVVVSVAPPVPGHLHTLDLPTSGTVPVQRHRGEPGHTRDRHKNLTNQPQRVYRYCEVLVSVSCVSRLPPVSLIRYRSPGVLG